MKHGILVVFMVLVAPMIIVGQAAGVDLDKYRSTPSPMGGIEAEETEGDFQPLNRSQVQEMQRILNEKGYNAGDADGYIGAQTQDAIREFQRDEGLAVTGNPNIQTLRALAPPERQEFFGVAPAFEEER